VEDGKMKTPSWLTGVRRGLLRREGASAFHVEACTHALETPSHIPAVTFAIAAPYHMAMMVSGEERHFKHTIFSIIDRRQFAKRSAKKSVYPFDHRYE
jgi:hypothetical protein